MMPSGVHKNDVTRKQLWNVLHHGHGRSGHAFGVAMSLLIIISVGILPLEFLPYFARYETVLLIAESIITAIFTVEYAVRIYAAPKRMKYILSFSGIVDLLSILPFFLSFLGSPYIRAIRIVRLLKIRDIEAAGAEEEESTLEHDVGLTPEERVEYIVTRHPLFLLFGCLPPAFSLTAGLLIAFAMDGHPIALAVAFSLGLFALIFFWKTWLDYSYDLIYVTSRRLIFQNQHLLGRSINQVNYFAITNVKPEYPNMISYILRYGTIVIDTPSAALSKVELHMVRDHERAAHLIMAKCTSHQELHSISSLADKAQ